MKILIINPPYQTLTSNLGVGHQIPLGLLMLGGPLIDAGHDVALLDAECERLSIRKIVEIVQQGRPQIVMTGHAGSTPAHPVCMEMLRAIKKTHPQSVQIYGGVYPTYHAAEILGCEIVPDFIVRGEGEATIVELIQLLNKLGSDDLDAFAGVAGITFRHHGDVINTPDRPPISDLDQFRIGWELITNWNAYHCFGLGRSAIIQLSRGCPHRCTYCGQHSFWVNWRYRDPVRVVNEIEWLHREHGIRFITLADENPTTLPQVWQSFLEELARRQLDVHFFATIRASDIVRDQTILPLYHTAGILYVLMGVDTTNARIQREIRKNSTPATDLRACQLLKQNGIVAMLGHIVGFEEETWADYRSAFRELCRYDADLLNCMYVTPHRWTQFAQDHAHRAVVQEDLSRWDYRHQILGQNSMPPWQVFAAVKWLEFCFHLRPRNLIRWLRVNNFFRWQMVWCLLHTLLVWLGEIAEFVAATRFSRRATSLSAFHNSRQPEWKSQPESQNCTVANLSEKTSQTSAQL